MCCDSISFPESVTANGRPLRRHKVLPATGSGFTFDDATHVLRIRHDSARDIDIQGSGGNAPPLYVTFDDPHLAAGTELEGAYPSGVIDWAQHEWKIGIPEGKFGTFNLIPVELHAGATAVSLSTPRACLSASMSTTAALPRPASHIRSEQLPDVFVTLHPGELRRVRTGWKEPASQITIELKNGNNFRFDNLRFDNLAYFYP